MSVAKPCFREANASGGLWGFGATELLVIVITAWMWTQLLGRPLRGVLLGVACAAILRILRQGRLRGSATALIGYLIHGRLHTVGGGDAPIPLRVRGTPYGQGEN